MFPETKSRVSGNIEIRDIEIRFPKRDFTFLNLSLIQYYIKCNQCTRSDWSISYGYIVPVNSRKSRASSELLYKSNTPQVAMVYRHDKSHGMLVEHSKTAARGLRIFLVFYQHPAWFISL